MMNENVKNGLSTDTISGWLTQNLPQLKQGFANALKTALLRYDQMQAVGRKETLAFVYVSYLRSSVLTGRPWFQLDLYDHKQWTDLEECAALWDTSKVTGRIYTDIVMPRNCEIDDLQFAITEKAWTEEAEKYFYCLSSFMSSIVSAAQVLVSDTVQFHYGEYMDKSEKI